MYCSKCGIIIQSNNSGLCPRCSLEQAARTMSYEQLHEAKKKRIKELERSKEMKKLKRKEFWKKAIKIAFFCVCPPAGFIYLLFVYPALNSETYPRAASCTYTNNTTTTSDQEVASPECRPSNSVFVDPAGNRLTEESLRQGGFFKDWQGNICTQGSVFYDSKGYRRCWGDPFYDGKGYYVTPGSPFYDADGNYVAP